MRVLILTMTIEVTRGLFQLPIIIIIIIIDTECLLLLLLLLSYNHTSNFITTKMCVEI